MPKLNILISLFQLIKKYRRTIINPKDFWWQEDQQVTVTNPTPEAYKFKVHNKEYEVGAGKVVKMPGYIAWVYVYGLSTQLAQANGEFNRWNEEGFRQTYYEKLVAGVDSLVQDVAPVEVEPTVNTFDEVATTPTAPEEPASDEEEGESVENEVAPMKAEPKAKALRSDRPAKV